MAGSMVEDGDVGGRVGSEVILSVVSKVEDETLVRVEVKVEAVDGTLFDTEVSELLIDVASIDVSEIVGDEEATVVSELLFVSPSVDKFGFVVCSDTELEEKDGVNEDNFVGVLLVDEDDDSVTDGEDRAVASTDELIIGVLLTSDVTVEDLRDAVEVAEFVFGEVERTVDKEDNVDKFELRFVVVTLLELPTLGLDDDDVLVEEVSESVFILLNEFVVLMVVLVVCKDAEISAGDLVVFSVGKGNAVTGLICTFSSDAS